MHGRGFPDLIAVLTDRSIRRELAGTSAVDDRHARPAIWICVGSRDVLLTSYVGCEVREKQIRVVPYEPIDQRTKHLGVATRKEATANQVDHFFQFTRQVVCRRIT